MSQAEIVKTRIISVVPTARAQLPVPVPGPAPETITTFAWTTQPVTVIEEVDLPQQLDPRLVVLSAPSSEQARSFRLLQHRALAQGDPRVIAVTSAEAGEGKTTCAANLALVLSEESLSRVLLIDANLVRPGLADLFGFDPADSFMTKLLRSEDAAPPYSVASIAGVRLQLAAIHPQMAQGKRVDRALLAEALRELRSTYDYIVIDTASVLESADVNNVCQCSDGVILTARAGRSQKSALARAVDQLKPATMLGAVLLDT